MKSVAWSLRSRGLGSSQGAGPAFRSSQESEPQLQSRRLPHLSVARAPARCSGSSAGCEPGAKWLHSPSTDSKGPSLCLDMDLFMRFPIYHLPFSLVTARLKYHTRAPINHYTPRLSQSSHTSTYHNHYTPAPPKEPVWLNGSALPPRAPRPRVSRGS